MTKKIYPRLPQSTWNNFNLNSPNTSMIEQPNTSAPIHYNNTLPKNDENDIYGITNEALLIQSNDLDSYFPKIIH